MLRLQADGTYPAAFAAIESPVLMLHGAFDPHPGEMIRASLAPHIRRLEYVEWERCGHYPWIERGVREQFFATLRDKLARDVPAERDCGTAAAPPRRNPLPHNTFRAPSP